jgi:hypothetical protein
MATLLLALLRSSSLKAHAVSCGTTQLKLELFLEALLKVNYSRHALEIMCERYICRRTPAVEADHDVHDTLANCAEVLFGNNSKTSRWPPGYSVVQADKGEHRKLVPWIVVQYYMHTTMLGSVVALQRHFCVMTCVVALHSRQPLCVLL